MSSSSRSPLQPLPSSGPPTQPAPAPRVALVTTLRDPGPSLDSFIRYHRAIGFDPLFLFFDDPQDPALHRAQRYAGVLAVPCDERVRARWNVSALAAARYAPAEVMARQTLNVEIAIDLARTMDVAWLLHLDIDELFYPAGEPVHAHFAAMTARGVSCVLYPNHEAVPERVEIADCFKEATLFKKGMLDTSRLTAVQAHLVAALPQLPPDVFHFYANGKSAVRLAGAVRPHGVHTFDVPPGHLSVWVNDGPVILHYPCCGFAAFWNKFRTLAEGYAGGRETWWGQAAAPRLGPFYRDACAVVRRGDEAAARAFYAERYVVADEHAVARLLDSGLCCRIEAPSQRLAALADPPGTDEPPPQAR